MLTDMLFLILFIGLNIASAFHVPLQHSRSHSRSYPFITEETNESRLRYKDDRDVDTEKNLSITRIKKSVRSPSSSFSRVTKSTAIQNLVTIDNLDDFKDYMNSSNDKVLVVRFFASWCQNCKRTEPSFNRFVRRNPNIAFVNIPFTKNNADLHMALNVSAVPYGQIYISSKLVDEMSLTMKNWSHFEKSVKQYYTVETSR